jgi:putative ABC transport system substrate-binding protein
VAQRREKVYRLGYLSVGSRDNSDPGLNPTGQAILSGLREYGYEEKKNIEFIFRWADGHYDRLPSLAAQLVALQPDLIMTAGTPAILALKNATRTVPIVMVVSGDAVATGLVSSLAKPGGNITGSTFFGVDLMVKRLELLKDVVPRLKRVGVLVNPDNQITKPTMRAMEQAKSLNVELQWFNARGADDLPDVFSETRKRRVDAVIVLEDGMLLANAGSIADLAIRSRLPALGSTEFAAGGCLVGYGARLADLYRRAGYFVDRILKGASPAAIPVERASSFDLVLNLRTARALGVKFPQALLQRADRVIE